MLGQVHLATFVAQMAANTDDWAHRHPTLLLLLGLVGLGLLVIGPDIKKRLPDWMRVPKTTNERLNVLEQHLKLQSELHSARLRLNELKDVRSPLEGAYFLALKGEFSQLPLPQKHALKIVCREVCMHVNALHMELMGLALGKNAAEIDGIIEPLVSSGFIDKHGGRVTPHPAKLRDLEEIVFDWKV